MIGVFIKELRENAKWAGAIFGVITLVVYTLIRRRSPYLLFDLAQPPMLVFVPLAGLLMGVVQSLFETSADNWAFVVHRPVSRRGIFAAKCAAGLLLLYLSLELPCLLAAAWAARPGNLRMPFQMRMMLPSLAVVLSAGCYYFVGMLLTLRRARWWGTRLLPVGFAVACSAGVWLAAEFWEALAIIVVGCGAGAVAAWGAFETGGAINRGLAGKMGLGAMLYVGAVGVGMGIVGFLGIFQSTKTWSWWRLDRDGTVLRVTTTLRGNERTSEVADASGRRIAELSGVDLDDPLYADRFVRFQNTLLDERVIPWPFSTVFYGSSYRQPQPGVIALTRAGKPGARMRAEGLYNVEERIIEVYDPMSRALLGRVGPAGFSAGRTTPRELFPESPLNPSTQGSTHTLAFESVVYWMELDVRRVRRIFTATADDPVVSATELPPVADPTVVIATRKRLHVMRPSGEAISTLTLDPDLTEDFYSVAMLPSNHHVVTWSGPLSPGDKTRSVESEFSSEREAKLVRRTETPAFEYRATMALPRTALFGMVYPVAASPLYRQWQWNWALDLGPERGWFFQEWALGSGIVTAIVALTLGRRYGFRWGRMMAWSAIGLSLGPAALVAMAGLNEMPARETCAACGGIRLSQRRECPQCAAALGPPRAEGWEIFEPGMGGVAGA